MMESKVEEGEDKEESSSWRGEAKAEGEQEVVDTFNKKIGHLFVLNSSSRLFLWNSWPLSKKMSGQLLLQSF